MMRNDDYQPMIQSTNGNVLSMYNFDQKLLCDLYVKHNWSALFNYIQELSVRSPETMMNLLLNARQESDGSTLFMRKINHNMFDWMFSFVEKMKPEEQWTMLTQRDDSGDCMMINRLASDRGNTRWNKILSVIPDDKLKTI